MRQVHAVVQGAALLITNVLADEVAWEMDGQRNTRSYVSSASTNGHQLRLTYLNNWKDSLPYDPPSLAAHLMCAMSAMR